MDEDEIARAIGQRFALRYLLGDIVVRICATHGDAAAYARAWQESSLRGLDNATDHSGGNEVVNHAALHELETFWASVRAGLPALPGKKPPPDDR